MKTARPHTTQAVHNGGIVGDLLGRWLNVEPQVAWIAARACLLFGALMGSYYLFKPARGSLYVHYLGAENLPYVYLGSAGIAFVAMAIYNRLFVRVALGALLRGTIWVLVACAAGFWLSHHFELVSLTLWSTLFFLWVSLYGALASTLFWSLANDIFDIEAGKRCYSVVGAGGIVGALFGSLFTDLVISLRLITTEDLLLLGMAILVVTVPLMRSLQRGNETPSGSDTAAQPPSKRRDGLRWLKEPYIASIAGLVCLMTFMITVLDLQYNLVVEVALADKEDKTAFFGRLYAMVNGIAIVTQLFVVKFVHRRWGPIPGLAFLPIVIACALVILLTTPSLTAVAIVWALGLGMLYSINQASKELLYVPLPREAKYGAKGYIDVFFFRLGDGLASVVAVAWRSVAGAIGGMGILAAALIPLWIVLLLAVRQGFHRRTSDELEH